MIKVLISMKRLNEHVVYVNFHGVSKVVSKHFVDQLLVGYTCILQTKRCDRVAEDAPFSDEYSILLFIQVHEDLVVA